MKKPKWQRECSAVFRQMRKDYPQLKKCGLVFDREKYLIVDELYSPLTGLCKNMWLRDLSVTPGVLLYSVNKNPAVIGVFKEPRSNRREVLCHEVAHALLDYELNHCMEHRNLTKKLYKKYFSQKKT